MYDRLLLPADGTPAGELGVSTGISVADGTRASLSLLTVVESAALGRFLWGGVTSKLVRTSPVPLLLTGRSESE